MRHEVRPPVWLLAAYPALVVAAVDPAAWSPYGPAKWWAVAVLGAGGAGWLIASGGVRLARAPALAVAALLVVVLLAAAFGRDPLLAWIGTTERHYGAVTWLLVAALFAAGQGLRDEGERRAVVLGVVVAGGVVGILGGLELLGWRVVDLDASTDRLTAAFGSAALLGAATCVLVPVAVGVALDASVDRRWRAVAWVGAGLGALALVGSGTRAAWIGLLVGGTTAGLVAVRRRLGGPAPPLMRLGAVAAAVVLVVAVGSAARPSAGRLGDLDGAGGGVASRLDEWRLGWRVVVANPALGVGPEGYRIEVTEHVDDDYERAHGRAVVPDRAHSGPLDVAATLGLPGLLAALAVAVTVARYLWRAMRWGPPALAGVAVAVLAYAVQQLFLFPLAELDPLVALLAGLVVVAGSRSGDGRPVPLPAPAGWAILVGTAVLTIAAGSEVLADRAARASLDALQRGELDDALADAQRAVRWRPDALRYHLLEAEVLAAPGVPDALRRAVEAVDDGLDVSPDDPVLRARRAGLLLGVARATGRLDDADAAFAAWGEAVAADPANGANLLDAGTAAAAAGRAAEAEEWWRRAGELSPGRATPWVNLARLLLGQGRMAEARAAADAALEADAADPDAREVFAEIAGRR